MKKLLLLFCGIALAAELAISVAMPAFALDPCECMNPTETHTENTLLAYAALKTMGGRESDLELIRNYFFAQKSFACLSSTSCSVKT